MDFLTELTTIFNGNIKSNNDRLDVYRDKVHQHEKFKQILRKYVFNFPNEDGEVFKKLDLIEKYGKDVLLISGAMYERIINCSSWFQFETSEDWKHHRVKKSNRCKHKYCPHCARVSALRRTLEAQHSMEVLHNQGYDFMFLTLTIKNVHEHEVKETMFKMNKALTDYFLKSKEIKNFCVGTIRKFELTYNPYLYTNNKIVKDVNGKKVIDTEKEPFNPHLHLIIAYDPKKYRGRYYVKHTRFRELWQRALKTDYLPLVNVQKVKRRKMTDEEKSTFEKEHAQSIEDNRIIDGAFEIGKYIAKSTEYLQSEQIFEMFFKNLFKRRAWTFSGLFKELHKENKGVRFETNLENNQIEYVYQSDYNFKNTDYFLTKVKKIEKG